jgi:hypothetical protein
LRSLAALPNLVDLSMSYLANVSDVALEGVACKGRLRKLVCRGCPTFTDVGCIRYINILSVSICTCLLVFTHCPSNFEIAYLLKSSLY